MSVTLHHRGRQEPQSKIVNTADQWGDTWMTPQRGQGVQWQTTQPNTPAPITLTITDPEDAKWLAQATSSGLDPASVITACRQRQQNYSRSQATNDQVPQAPKISSSLLPSGLVACNECAHVSATFELADKHQKDVHPEPAWTLPPFWNTGNRQKNDMVPASTIEKPPNTLPSKLVACNKCSHLSATFETADIHQIEAHPGLANEPDRRN